MGKHLTVRVKDKEKKFSFDQILVLIVNSGDVIDKTKKMSRNGIFFWFDFFMI
jgi:hypothetical protein